MLTTFRRNQEYGTRRRCWLRPEEDSVSDSITVDKTSVNPCSSLNTVELDELPVCGNLISPELAALGVREIRRLDNTLSTDVSVSKEIQETIEPLRVKIYKPQAAWAQSHGPVEFIADTGSSFYVLPQEEISERMRRKIHQLAKPINMATVNGSITVDSAVRVAVPNLDREVEFIIVADSPPLLSVGRLCMLEGFGFFWPPKKSPWLVSPTGKRIPLSVHDFVPYCTAAKPKTVEKPDPVAAAVLRDLVSGGLPEDPEAGGMGVDPHRPLSTAGPSHQPVEGGGATDPEAPQGPEVPAPPEDVPANGRRRISQKKPVRGGELTEVPLEAAEQAILPASSKGVISEKERLERAESKSLRHLMTHLPKNAYCEHCQRAKFTAKPARIRHWVYPSDEATAFGDRVLCDTLIARKQEARGIDDEGAAICFMDEATDFTDCFPTAGRNYVDAAQALNDFEGPDRVIKCIYSDGAPEFKKMCRKHRVEGVAHDVSTPYRHTAGAKIERRNRWVLDGTRTALERSGRARPVAASGAPLLLCLQHTSYRPRRQPVLQKAWTQEPC